MLTIMEAMHTIGNMQILGTHAVLGLGAFVLVSTVLLFMCWRGASFDVVTLLQLIGTTVVGNYYVIAGSAFTAPPTASSSQPGRRTSMQRDNNASNNQLSGKCPAATGMRSLCGELTIAGCTLLPLSAVDRAVLASAGDLNCDCTFLDVSILLWCVYYALLPLHV
jgi:hypothetical protein